jgi:hypothetical protein
MGLNLGRVRKCENVSRVTPNSPRCRGGGNSGVRDKPRPVIKLRYRLLRLLAALTARLFMFISSDVTQPETSHVRKCDLQVTREFPNRP